MSKKLYVGNLPYEATAESLKSTFGQAGTVLDATVITDKMTNRSRGFGFVEMEDADADKAIEMWDGKELEGRRLKVNEARPMERSPRRG